MFDMLGLGLMFFLFMGTFGCWVYNASGPIHNGELLMAAEAGLPFAPAAAWWLNWKTSTRCEKTAKAAIVPISGFLVSNGLLVAVTGWERFLQVAYGTLWFTILVAIAAAGWAIIVVRGYRRNRHPQGATA